MSTAGANIVRSRKSHRRFDPNRPIPDKLLRELLEDALRSPSWSNTQPWEVYVVTGAALERLRKSYLETHDRSEPYAPEVPMPQTWPEDLQDRSRRNSIRLFENVGIAREDQEARAANWRNNFQFFNAPALVILCQDRTLTEWSVMDLGTFGGYLMLAAEQHGIQSVPAFSSVAYPKLLRAELDIPEHLLIRTGILLGYAEEDHPYNRHVSEREPLERLVHFKQ